MKQQDIVRAISNVSYAQGYIDAKTERDDIYEELQYAIDLLRKLLNGDTEKPDRGGCVGCRYIKQEIDMSPCNMCKHSYQSQWTQKENE